MTEYLRHAITLVDQLALLSHAISKPQVVEYICNHLGENWESFILTLSKYFSSLSMEDWTAMLLT